MHLVGFILRIYHDARSPERQISVQCLLENLFSGTKRLAKALY